MHLDDDGLARAQPRAIRLSDRRGRERLPVELGEDLLDVGAELGFEHRPHRLPSAPARLGSATVASSRADLGREEVDAGCGDLPELDVDATGLLEDAPDAHARAVERTLGALAARQERSEPFAPGQAKQLAIAPQHRDAPAERTQRARRHHEAGVLPRSRANPGRASRSRVTATAIVAGMPIASVCTTRSSLAPVPVREVQREKRRDTPPDDAGEQRATPAAPDAEQPQRDGGREHRDRDAERRRAAATSGTDVATHVTIPPGTGAPPRRRGVRSVRRPRTSSTSVVARVGSRARRRRRT